MKCNFIIKGLTMIVISAEVVPEPLSSLSHANSEVFNSITFRYFILNFTKVSQ